MLNTLEKLWGIKMKRSIIIEEEKGETKKAALCSLFLKILTLLNKR